jgi:hypothetical protein
LACNVYKCLGSTLKIEESNASLFSYAQPLTFT